MVSWPCCSSYFVGFAALLHTLEFRLGSIRGKVVSPTGLELLVVRWVESSIRGTVVILAGLGLLVV